MVDHIVYAVRNLEEGIASIFSLTGIEPVIGGRHEGLGSWNALLSLGDEIYLEILAPDPSQKIQPTWFGLDQISTSKITRWAGRSYDLGLLRDKAIRLNLPIGEVLPFSRRTPGGELLSWELTDPETEAGDDIFPFFIDWLDTDHPEKKLEKGCQLMELKAYHPQPGLIQEQLLKLGIKMEVSLNDHPSFSATIETTKGAIELR